jgi:hypothetical protein
MANDNANKNHNPNYTNLYEFANNPNKNKLKTQKSFRSFVKINFNLEKNKIFCN